MTAASLPTLHNAITGPFSAMNRSTIEEEFKNKIREATVKLQSTTQQYYKRCYSEWTGKSNKPSDHNKSKRFYGIKNAFKPSNVNTTLSSSRPLPDVDTDTGLDNLEHVQLLAVHSNLNDTIDDVKEELNREREIAPRES